MNKPETLSQARSWDHVRDTYERDGFCAPCASQAAWGHQLGFTQVSQVCDKCAGTEPTYRSAGARARAWAAVNGSQLAAGTDVSNLGPRTPGQRCPCGSTVSGFERWGVDWGGECDRAEARAAALIDRLRASGHYYAAA